LNASDARNKTLTFNKTAKKSLKGLKKASCRKFTNFSYLAVEIDEMFRNPANEKKFVNELGLWILKQGGSKHQA
jgi:hypothetical protein